MKIILPAMASKYDDWTDNEKVLMSLFFHFYSLDGIRDTTYFVHSKDIRHILGILKAANPSKYLDNIRRVLRIGLLSWDVWSIQLMYDNDSKSSNGRLLSYEDTITDLEAIKTFSYLAGRVSAPDIISEVKNGPTRIASKEYRVKPVMGYHFAYSLLPTEE